MYQDFTNVKIKSTQEKGYVIPSDDSLDDSMVTVDVSGITKVFNIDDVEIDNEPDNELISNNDAMNLAQALINEQRAKKENQG